MPSRPSWSRGFRAFTGLSFNLNFQSRLKLHSEVVLLDDDSLEPALYQSLIEGFQVCGLLLDEILQFIDVGNLCVPGSSVDGAFFSLFSEFEDLVGNLIIGLFVIGLFKRFFLKLLKFFVDPISGILLSASDHLCNNVGKPCEGEPHARFDEGRMKISSAYSTRKRQTAAFE